MKSHFDELIELVNRTKSNYDEWLRKQGSLSLEDLLMEIKQKLEVIEEIGNQLNTIRDKYPKGDSDQAMIIAAEFLNRLWVERLLFHAVLVFSMKLANDMREVVSKTRKKEIQVCF